MVYLNSTNPRSPWLWIQPAAFSTRACFAPACGNFTFLPRERGQWGQHADGRRRLLRVPASPREKPFYAIAADPISGCARANVTRFAA